MIAKMSIYEVNVKRFLSTGPWERIEKLCEILCDIAVLREETPVRDSTYFILNAFCEASKPFCMLAAFRGNIIRSVILFLEDINGQVNNVRSYFLSLYLLCFRSPNLVQRTNSLMILQKSSVLHLLLFEELLKFLLNSSNMKNVKKFL